MLRRQYIGIDLSAEYITYAQARLAAISDNLPIQELLL
jgi:DNA modification methylase